MLKKFAPTLAAVALLASAPAAAAPDLPGSPTERPLATDFVKISKDIRLRRLVVRPARPEGTVLLLHGFPETLYAWQDVARQLGDRYEVHAFDWPGYGQSSRPRPDRFAYAPRDYAKVLRAYIARAGIDRARLTIYATDIGALPVLIALLDEPDLARSVIVGDFAPFDRPPLMHERLQRLKALPASEAARLQLNANRDDTLENAFKRGLKPDAQFALSPAFRADMARGWDHGLLTSADAFFHYYSHFTRDQDWFEANLSRLRTKVAIVWGADDPYIHRAMGEELARRTGAPFKLLPGIGHYPHLQAARQTADEIRASFR